MTTMVRLAERDGLVERRADPADRRATTVHLTDRAKRFRPAAERVLRELERLVVAELGESRVATLRRALDRVGELERR
jgi:DNA-binding MarR family transcriptional regulator